MTARVGRVIPKFLGFLLLLAVWQTVVSLADLSPVLLPPPLSVAEAFQDQFAKGLLLGDLIQSLQRVVVGFLGASVVAVTLGILLARVGWLSTVAHPLLETLRPIPPIAWIPLAILWFGIGNGPSYFVVGIGAFFPAFVNTYAGVTSVDPRYLEAARCLGATRRQLVFEVVVPAALPYVLTGLRVGLGIAWMAVVAAELIAAKSGLGYMIQLNRSLLETANVLVGMIMIGVVGFLMSWGLRLLQKRLTPWQEDER